jgi:hypothetical protein
MLRGLFVSYRAFLDGAQGGVQACTGEYIEVITAAGIELGIIPFDGDRRLSTRLLRRFDSSPYLRPVESPLFETIGLELGRKPIDFIFLNQASLAPIAQRLRGLASQSTSIILLSHGLESTDLLHLLRLRHKLPLNTRVRPSADTAMGRALRIESSSREHVDAVLTLSPFDVEAERWIGARRVEWLPRVITAAPLDWRPSGLRLGYVGTLDHAPNLEGLVMVLDEFSGAFARPPNIRVVSGSTRIGAWLASRYPFVDYLGGLDADGLTGEAASWSGFLNPIFCSPRGCSTKLATAIGWQIPIVTTPQGRRGYQWRKGSLLEAENPEGFAHHAMALFDPEFAAAARVEVGHLRASSPTLSEVAARLRRFLDRFNAGVCHP